MSRPYAVVIEVNRTPTGDAAIRLDVIAGRCPRWLVLRRPPKHFEAIIGETIEVDHDGVYVGGRLWAKRMPRSPNEIVLIARRKA